MTTDPACIPLPSDRDGSGRDLGEPELALLREVIASGHLNCTGGTATAQFERAFAERMGTAHAVACTSGTAAIHTAVACLGLAAGDEVITTPITDMGAILPILYEGGIPVFADVDPADANVSADSIAARMTGRTRAVVATHLFGQPCEMRPIRELCRRHDLRLIEDCAQAFLARDGDAMVGTFGDFACYSFQQGKHLTTGEGGILTTGDAELADRARRFVNKGWGYGDENPDHDRPGLNYRMTELHAAVGLAQLLKLDFVVDRRRARALEMHECLGDLPGVARPIARPGSTHSYWRYALSIDPDTTAGTDAFAAELRRADVACLPRYIKKPAFECAVFRELERFPALSAGFDRTDRAPAELYAGHDYPGCRKALARLLVLPWNEHYTSAHVHRLTATIHGAHRTLVHD